MVSNISQAINLLHVYLETHFGHHFSALLLLADSLKYHQSKNETYVWTHQLDQMHKRLVRDFHVSQQEVYTITAALIIGIDQFHEQLVKVMLKQYKKPNLFKQVEDDIAKISKELQGAPYHHHLADFENCLRIGILFQLHFDLDQREFADQWAELANTFDPQYLNGEYDSIYDEYIKVILNKWKYLYFKYCDDPDFSIYVLNLIHTLPYQSSAQ